MGFRPELDQTIRPGRNGAAKNAPVLVLPGLPTAPEAVGSDKPPVSSGDRVVLSPEAEAGRQSSVRETSAPRKITSSAPVENGSPAPFLEAETNTLQPGTLPAPPSLEDFDSFLGRKIGQFKITDRLGEGAMGVVFLAEEEGTGRVVALKVSKSELGEGDINYLEREATRLAAATGAPHIQQIIASGYDGEMFFVATELIRGESLSHILRSGRRFSVPEAMEIMRSVCVGLSGLHSQGVLHRDVNPRNVHFHDPTRQVTVLDLGLAIPSHEATPGISAGTRGFMSPEQFLGERAAPHYDTFATATLFYQLVHGQKVYPYQLTPLGEVQYPIAEESAYRGLPRPVRNILARSLHLDPNLRYQDAPSQKADADAYLADEEAGYRSFRGVVEAGVEAARKGRSDNAGTVIYFRERVVEVGFEDAVQRAFPAEKGYVVFRSDREGMEGIFVYTTKADETTLLRQANEFRAGEGRTSNSEVLVRGVRARDGKTPADVYQTVLVDLTQKSPREHMQKRADDFQNRLFDKRRKLTTRLEKQLTAKWRKIGLSERDIFSRLSKLRSVRLAYIFGEAVVQEMRGPGFRIMDAPDAETLIREMAAYRDGRRSEPPRGLLDPDGAIRTNLRDAYRQYQGRMIDSIERAIDRGVTPQEKVRFERFIAGALRDPAFAEHHDQFRKLQGELAEARVEVKVPVEVERAMGDLGRALASPEIRGRLTEYFKGEGRELLKTKEGRELLAKLQRVAAAPNWRAELRLEGAGILVGLVTLVGAEKLADIIGLPPSSPQRFVFVLGASHIANLNAQGLLMGKEAAAAAKLASILSNPSVLGRVVSQMGGLFTGLAEMTLVTVLSDKLYQTAGLSPEFSAYASTATGFVLTPALHFASRRVVASLGSEAMAAVGMRLFGRIAGPLGAATLIMSTPAMFSSAYRQKVNERVYQALQAELRRTGQTGDNVAAAVIDTLHVLGGSGIELAGALKYPEEVARVVRADIEESKAVRTQLVADLNEYLAQGGQLSDLTQKAEWGTIRVPTGTSQVVIIAGPNGATGQVIPGYEDISEQAVFEYMYQAVKADPKLTFGSPEHLSAVTAHFGGKITAENVVAIVKKGVTINFQVRFAGLAWVQPSIFGEFSTSTVNDDIRTWFDSSGVLKSEQTAAFRKGFLGR